jgi:hypothetical protein
LQELYQRERGNRRVLEARVCSERDSERGLCVAWKYDGSKGVEDDVNNAFWPSDCFKQNLLMSHDPSIARIRKVKKRVRSLQGFSLCFFQYYTWTRFLLHFN